MKQVEYKTPLVCCKSRELKYIEIIPLFKRQPHCSGTLRAAAATFTTLHRDIRMKTWHILWEQ